jgi:heterotetrameric sarcosine oxidase delta subunit
MLLITCPICTTTAGENAFTCGGDAHVERPQSTDPSDVSPEQLSAYLNLSPSPRGWCREQWLCHACDSWFVMLRHSLTNQIAASYRIGQTPPPLPEALA